MSEMPDKIPGEPEISEAELKKMFPMAAKLFSETNLSDFYRGMVKERANGDVNVENMLLGVLSGLPFLDFDVPEWVKRASLKFFEGTVLNGALPDENADWVEWMGAIGYGLGLIEEIFQKPASSSVAQRQRDKMLSPMLAEIKTFASNSKAEESAAFFNARLKGEKSREFAGQMTVPTKICMLIALYWKDVPTLQSTAKLHEALMEIKKADGEKLFSFHVDSRETRRICKDIGLQFKNSWNKADSKI